MHPNYQMRFLLKPLKFITRQAYYCIFQAIGATFNYLPHRDSIPVASRYTDGALQVYTVCKTSSSMALWLTLSSLMTSIHYDRFWVLFLFLQPFLPVTLKSAWTSFNHLSSGLPAFLFPSSFASNTLLGILLLSIVIKWPSHSSFLSLTSVTVSTF